MFVFFEGPEPSDGLLMKKVSSIPSTDWDMIIGGKVSGDGESRQPRIFSTAYNRTPGDSTSGIIIA